MNLKKIKSTKVIKPYSKQPDFTNFIGYKIVKKIGKNKSLYSLTDKYMIGYKKQKWVRAPNFTTHGLYLFTDLESAKKELNKHMKQFKNKIRFNKEKFELWQVFYIPKNKKWFNKITSEKIPSKVRASRIYMYKKVS